MPRLIEARYHGWCGECGEEIEPGDLIGFVETRVVCEDCRVEHATIWDAEADAWEDS